MNQIGKYGMGNGFPLTSTGTTNLALVNVRDIATGESVVSDNKITLPDAGTYLFGFNASVFTQGTDRVSGVLYISNITQGVDIGTRPFSPVHNGNEEYYNCSWSDVGAVAAGDEIAFVCQVNDSDSSGNTTISHISFYAIRLG